VDGISKVFEKFLTFGDEKVREGKGRAERQPFLRAGGKV
jgi:hypothetical protein